jgi:hypothetical protein
MKKLLTRCALIGSVALPIFLNSCIKDAEGLTPEVKQRILLSREWSVSSVLLDGVDITDLGYANLQMTFLENGTWQCANGGDIFGSTGTWSFANGNPEFNQIVLSGLSVDITLKGQTSILVLMFSKSSASPIGGRLGITTGFYQITFAQKFKP